MNGNSWVIAVDIIEYTLANKAMIVPIKSTGTGYIDSIKDIKANPKYPVVPMPISITANKYYIR